MSKEKLVKSIGGIKSRVTRFKNQLEKDSSTLTLSELKSIQNRLYPLYSKYDEVQIELEVIDSENSYDTEREEFEETFGTIDSQIISLIDSKKNNDAASTSCEKTVSKPSSSSEDQTMVLPQIPLPEMRLPEFDGNFMNWTDFSQIYTELIQNNTRVSPIVKFQYLRSALEKGSAFHFIKGIVASPQTYEDVWKSLSEFYSNEARLKYACMKELYYLKPVKKENDAIALRMFIDSFWKQYNSLKSLKIPIKDWDLYLIFHVSELLDTESRREVELKKAAKEIPTIKEIMDTLSERARILEAMSSFTKNRDIRQNTSAKPQQSLSKSSQLPSLVTTHQSDVKYSIKCKYCNQGHSIFQCNEFNGLSWNQRNDWVREARVCRNCLGSHYVNKCTSKSRCKTCNQWHHTLLHIEFRNNLNSSTTSIPQTTQRVSEPPNFYNPIETVQANSCLHSSLHNILLFTAVVWVRDVTGNKIPCRVLLDSASHTNFITEELCQKLGTRKMQTSSAISGINQQISQSKYMTEVTVESRVGSYATHLNFLVIPKITGELPLYPVEFSRNSIDSSFELGDPAFFRPNTIDMLIGAEVYDEIMLQNRVEISNELPPFRESQFGYLVCGRTNPVNGIKSVSLACCSTDQLHHDLQKFWQIEEINAPNNYSLSEKLCEDKFVESINRDESGRYCVSLPFKSSPNRLGNSSKNALKQFYYMEQRLNKNSILKNEYIKFMEEYESLNHMTKINENQLLTKSNYFMPHHAVTREESTTTKVRVVFNASAKSTTGISLNDILLTGPTIQPDILTMLIRFRMFKIAISADITKMYRQININPADRNFQVIYWRKSSSEPLSVYQLNTVTYGTASAPFLAIRTLKQLAYDEALKYPTAAPILLNNFYVDDLVAGSDTSEKAIMLKEELQSLLVSGGFELRKWTSNNKAVIPLDFGSTSDTVSILGIRWNHVRDSIKFRIGENEALHKLTKRKLLSIIAKFYDPIGICAPVILSVKIFLQRVWTIPGIQWDDVIPENLASDWIEFCTDINSLQDIEIPRCLLTFNEINSIELHGFGDASESGYGCAIYIRTENHKGEFHCQLLCAKSKVAPLKRHTIPRLELCASLLLAQLYHKVIESIQTKFNRINLWSDSEITLYRIKSEPSKYPTFVANRISKIQDLSSPSLWRYIPSTLNPADLVSRGIRASQLQACDLWWRGPSFLSTHMKHWPASKFDLDTIDDPEMLTSGNTLISVSLAPEHNYFAERYSNFNQLLRIAALCLRFLHNARFHVIHKRVGLILTEEINLALFAIIKSIQNQFYQSEIGSLKLRNQIAKQSSIKRLNVFLDQVNILRVGGRLENADLPWDQKHPILIPNCQFSQTLVEYEHIRNMHAGPQALLSFLRQRFWIIDAKNLCNKVCRKCVRCFRMRPTIINQLMGQLPPERVGSFRAFLNTGIDVCGPFPIISRLRSNVVQKAYISLFVCFSTKAVHLEVVSDLSTPAFIAALRRFMCRRGKCANIYSDNATNFVGAKAELKELKRLFESEQHKNDLSKFFCEENIVWHHIPPRSPHFGGLWEAAVKSAKYHLKRVVGTNKCTLEEITTLTVQIEAILNSRPLTPLSNNIDDYSVLTPGHFLIGGPLNAAPEPSLSHLDFNRLSRFQKLQFNMQGFWKRWSREYLMELQGRQKWTVPNNSIKVGKLVLLHEDNIPAMHWIMGRIVETHPGADDLIRVVTVKTAAGLFKRAITRISILPMEYSKFEPTID